jgi:hypothetical protein
MKNKTFIVLFLLFIVTGGCNNKKNNQDKTLVEENINIDLLALNSIALNKYLDSLVMILEKTELKESDNTADIPFFFRQRFNDLTNDNFSIANPGEEWQISDVIFDDTLPWRQLAYLGVGKNIILISYYHGGIGVSNNVIIVRHKDKKILDFWSGYVFGNIESKNEIIKALKDDYNRKIWKKIGNNHQL